MNRRDFIKKSAVGLGSASVLGGGVYGNAVNSETAWLDIAPFARRCSAAEQHTSPLAFDYDVAERAGRRAEQAADGRYIYGLQWAEERDIKEIRARFEAGSAPEKAAVEYWSYNWPYPAPQMPLTEGPVEDPWEGQWLKAATRIDCTGPQCRYTFEPLSTSENPRADNLPELDYRRTLKVRLVFASEPRLEQVEVFTGSVRRKVAVRIELGAGEAGRHEWRGAVSVYNGLLKGVKLWNGSAGDSVEAGHFQVTTGGAAKGLSVDLIAAQPSLPGSEDVTIVTAESGDRTFSFAVPDLDKGPIYVPVFHAYVSLASDARNFSPSVVDVGAKIRERLRKEPEQTYERATKEIPPLDPTDTDGHGKLYLPLGADASWQKFAFEWGGNIFISKQGTKAKGAELKRLEWSGDRICWWIGTGATPTFRPGWKDSTLRMLDGEQLVAIADWSSEGIRYTEEGYATLLSGPLSPEESGRSEETPAVLMLKIVAQNTASAPTVAHLWLATEPLEQITDERGEVTAEDGQLVRARVKLPEGGQVKPAMVSHAGQSLPGIHVEVPLEASEARSVFLSIPFIPRLSPSERAQLASLDYEQERSRVVSYWREIMARAVSLDIPEERFAKLVKAFLPRCLMSVTKDPKSGLYMVPAGSYYYAVFANVGSLQCVTLDYLGYPQLAAKYLETFIRLQGNRPMLGTFQGDQRAVYHGARLDAEYDYTSGEYILDHGGVLYQLTQHYFLTRDKEWLRRMAPSMMRAADWIVEQAKLTQVLEKGEKVPEYGLLPAAPLEDNPDWGHWVAVNAECVGGMSGLAEALADLGAPEAGQYAEKAAAYKQDVRDAVLRATRKAAVVRLRDNTYIPYVPTRIHQRTRQFGPITTGYYSRYPEKIVPLYYFAAVREVFAGPILLLLRDVFHHDEAIADWILDDWEDNTTMSKPLGLNVHGWVDEKYWFSQGSMDFETMRSPTPVFLRRNEVPATIRDLYNSFVATYYPDPMVLTEWFNQWGHGAGPLYKTADDARFVNRLRLMLVREEGETLWLAAGVPRRWLSPGKKIEIKNAATYFGPVSYRIEASESGVDAQVLLPTRNPANTVWLVLRYPDEKPIRAVEINGKCWQEFEATNQRIHLPMMKGPMQVSVHF